jgi:hypothetical protein
MTIGEKKQERLKKLGAEVRALGTLMEHLTNMDPGRLVVLATDLEHAAKEVRRI